jgi:hypothetical protein
MGNYLENKLIDQLFRGQAFSFPTTLYMGLLTSASSDSTLGTEVTGGDYERASISSSLLNWSGTQSVGSTSASTGVSGTTSNNVEITFPTPSASWGVVTHFAIYDSLTGGNMLFWSPLTDSKSINNGDPSPSFPPNSLSVQIDN